MIEWSGGASRIPFVAMNIYLVLVLFSAFLPGWRCG